MKKQLFDIAVIGSSAGGIRALSIVLEALPADFPLPVAIVQHLHPDSDSYLTHILGAKTAMRVKQADEKEPLLPGTAYIAPPNYHLLIESDRTLSLSVDERVNYARPSVDVLFECAADVFKDRIAGIILTGANSDGALGLKKIKLCGGYAIVQDPATAEADSMPRSALAEVTVDRILPLNEIGPFLLQLVNRARRAEQG